MSRSPLQDALRSATRELELAWAGEEERELELTETERYSRDPFRLLELGHVWIWSKFDRRPVRLVPFPTQRELLEAWIDLETLQRTGQLTFCNTADEKSRQMGETWIVAFGLLWALHFHTVSLFAHHYRAAEIDDGGERNTWKSLFGKVRYMDRRLGSTSGLPAPQQRAAVPGLGKLTFRPYSREPAKIENAARDSVVYGGEQSTDPGRGGSFDGAVIDEAAFVPWGEKVHGALDEACPTGKLYLSTPQGDDNIHARIVDERPRGWRILRHHWSEHPLYRVGLHVAGVEPEKQPDAEMRASATGCKLCQGNLDGRQWSAEAPLSHRFPGRLTSPWYDERVIGKTDEQVAQELDIDRERALTGRVYSEFQTEIHVVAAGIPYEHNTAPLELGFDYGLDCTSVVICQDKPDAYCVLGELEMGDVVGTTATPENVSAALRQVLEQLGVPARELTPFWTKKLYAIGDPAGHARSMESGRPFIEAYHRQGFAIGRPPQRLGEAGSDREDWLGDLQAGGPDVNPELTGSGKFRLRRDAQDRRLDQERCCWFLKLPVRSASWGLNPRDPARRGRSLARRSATSSPGTSASRGTRARSTSWDEMNQQGLQILAGARCSRSSSGATSPSGGRRRRRAPVRPLARLAPRYPRSIQDVAFENGRVKRIEQWHPKASPIPGDKLSYMVFEREGGRWDGVAMIRPAWGPWRLKKALMIAAGIGWDRFALGLPVSGTPTRRRTRRRRRADRPRRPRPRARLRPLPGQEGGTGRARTVPTGTSRSSTARLARRPGAAAAPVQLRDRPRRPDALRRARQHRDRLAGDRADADRPVLPRRADARELPAPRAAAAGHPPDRRGQLRAEIAERSRRARSRRSPRRSTTSRTPASPSPTARPRTTSASCSACRSCPTTSPSRGSTQPSSRGCSPRPGSTRRRSPRSSPSCRPTSASHVTVPRASRATALAPKALACAAPSASDTRSWLTRKHVLRHASRPSGTRPSASPTG
jgi:hypothetical protein